MRVRVNKKWNIEADTFQLTKEEIASQALNDLLSYKKKYYEKYQKYPSQKFDVDNFVEVMWGFNVVYEDVPQTSEETQILGFLRPETKEVVIDANCEYQKRISFTVAHEAGHLSLHQSFYLSPNSELASKNKARKQKLELACKRREWQADAYAGALLAPREEIELLLLGLGFIKKSILIPFNFDEQYPKFEEKFGMSKQAMKIRLENLKIPFISEVN